LRYVYLILPQCIIRVRSTGAIGRPSPVFRYGWAGSVDSVIIVHQIIVISSANLCNNCCNWWYAQFVHEWRIRPNLKLVYDALLVHASTTAKNIAKIGHSSYLNHPPLDTQILSMATSKYLACAPASIYLLALSTPLYSRTRK
jgi:hypothetical protein